MADGLKQDLYEKIVQQYQETKSVRDTAQRCGTSLVTAQRVLITEGLWESKRSKCILRRPAAAGAVASGS